MVKIGGLHVSDAAQDLFVSDYASLDEPFGDLAACVTNVKTGAMTLARVRNKFRKYYIRHLQREGSKLVIVDNNRIIKRNKIAKLSVDAIENGCKIGEQCMSMASEGGIYQSATRGSIKTICDTIKSLRTVRRNDVFFDLGCGQNRVTWIASQYLGCLGAGIEVCPARANIAAATARGLLQTQKNMRPWNQKVALFHGNAKTPANWKGIHIFFCWDTAFLDESTDGIYNNIARSFEDDDEEKVLIHSKKKVSRIRQINDMFHVIQRKECSLAFFKGSSSVTMEVMIIRRKNTTVPTGKNPSKRLMEEAGKFFLGGGTVQAYAQLEQRIEHSLPPKPSSIAKRRKIQESAIIGSRIVSDDSDRAKESEGKRWEKESNFVLKSLLAGLDPQGQQKLLKIVKRHQLFPGSTQNSRTDKSVTL